MGQAWHSRGGLNDLPTGERIALVIEPQSARRVQAATVLRGIGYKTYATGCGAVGQFIVSQLSVDVIVADVVLPDLDGLQLVRQLRVRLPDAVIVAIAPTEENWEATALHAYAAGADFALSTILGRRWLGCLISAGLHLTIQRARAQIDCGATVPTVELELRGEAQWR